MEDKEAIAILLSLKDRHDLSVQEQEAVSAAVGILGWSTLAQSSIRARKEKRERAR